MTAQISPARSPAVGELLGPVVQRLPGLADALDGDLAARQLQTVLAVPGVDVERATPEAVWFRADGSCSLRYRVEVSGGRGGDRLTVLARVCGSARAARGYLDAEVLPLAPAPRPADPWRQWGGTFEDSPVAVHAFPLDPTLPTLGAATDLVALPRLRWPTPEGLPSSVEVVRHSREGAAVLRYQLSRTAGRAALDPEVVYGKVHGDSTGATVHRLLTSLGRSPRLAARARTIRLPASLGYLVDLRLLLTEALPGQPLLPALVRAAVSAEPTSRAAGGRGPSPAPSGRDVLLAAVRETGQALAALHNVAEAAAPVAAPGRSERDLERELELVAPVWPETAEAVRCSLAAVRCLDAEPANPGLKPAGRVLCHGDFTPSQVLFSHGRVTGLVDLDTAAWGDPAVDLGRFLAHLDLLVAKAAGQPDEQLSRQLAGDFLHGYREVARRPDAADPGSARLLRARSVALALSALHACRQLKEGRRDLALSLLRSGTTSRLPYSNGHPAPTTTAPEGLTEHVV